MARAKKQSEEISPNDEFLVAEEGPPAQVAPILVKKRLHQEWVEPMPVAAPQGEVVQVVEEMEVPAEIYDKPADTEPDPIRKLLDRIGGNQREYSMVVYRLPNYHRDGNSSIRSAKKINCGHHPFDEYYEDTIRELYVKPDKPNDFLVLVRYNGRTDTVLPVISLEYSGKPDAAPAQGSENHNVISATVTPVDPFTEMEKALKLVERFNKLSPKTDPTPTRAEAEEMTTEAALLKVAMTDKKLIEEIASGISAKIFPNAKADDSIPGWMQGLIQLLAPVVPALLQKLTAPPDTSPQPQQVVGAGQHVTAPAPAGAPPIPPEYLKMREIMGRIVYGIRNGFQPDFIAEEIDMLCDKDEVLDGICTEFFSQQIATIQAAIAQNIPPATPVIKTPEAAQWITEMMQFWAQPAEETK